MPIRPACLLRAALLAAIWLCLGAWAPCKAEEPVAATKPAAADPGFPKVRVRFAIHDGFDRLVLYLPEGSQAVSHQVGSTLSIRISGAGIIDGEGLSGRRLRAVQGGLGETVIQMIPGARGRVWRMDDRLVIDVLDPSTVPVALVAPQPKPSIATREASRAPPPATAMPPSLPKLDRMPSGRSSPAAVSVEGLPALATMPAAPVAAAMPAVPTPSSSTQAWHPAAPTGSPPTMTGAAVVLLQRDAGMADPAIFLPVGRDTGAAIFARSGLGHAVFDLPQALDLSALKDDPVFGSVTEQMLPNGIHLRLHLPSSGQLRLVRRDDGWILVVKQASSDPSATPMTGHVHGGILTLDAEAPGRIVTVDDEATGGRLLVGTQRVVGQRMANAHLASEFSILPTWQGLVVEPVSDRVQLRTTGTGFELSAPQPPALSVAWSEQITGTWPDGRAMTRLFDLPDLPIESLHRRLGQALRDAAMAPKPARYRPRLSVAQAMLALGMDVEATSVLHAAAADDPAHRDDRVAAGLAAMSAWLSAQAGGGSPPALDFDPAELGGSDEAALWRALLQPDHSDIASQAAALAATWPMIVGYPANMRRLMLRPAAAVLRAGGQDKALAAFLAACPDPGLDLFRAARLHDQNKTDEALALMDRVAGRPDRLTRAQALEEAVELRLSTRRLDPAAAAQALDRQIYAWRGGDRELRLRERVAQLRAQAGSWRTALAMLRETGTQFPDARAQLRTAETGIVTDLLRGNHADKLSAFDLVTLADEDADLLTNPDAQASLAPVLVDKLLALDLPRRAEPILRHLFDTAPNEAVKAEIGVRLAGLIADRDEAADALNVLSASADDGLSQALTSRRALLRAHVLTVLGKPNDALAALAEQHGQDAIELQAAILERQHDWRAAATVLAPALKDAGFMALPDTAQRDAILRLARDQSEAGDTAALRRLWEEYHARFASGQGAELFGVLTAEPIQTAADLPRSARELSEIRALPAKLATTQPF